MLATPSVPALASPLAAWAARWPAAAAATPVPVVRWAGAVATRPEPRPLQVRFFERDGSVFLDDRYLIKGVAGALFWKLARAWADHGRTDFTTRELRLAADELRLPELKDNLDVRLLLLQRRLAERGGPVRIERTGRGRYRFIAPALGLQAG